MKNLHIERLKIRAKQYHRTQRADHFQDGMLIFHAYDGLPMERLTWWDDVTFIVNDYRAALIWTHPRMAYEDAIDTEADRSTSNFLQQNLMREGTPVYKTLGKSRKKIISTSYEPVNQTERRLQWRQARQQVMQSADIQIQPSLTSRWCKYSRLVYLCAPIEVRDKADLRQLVDLTRRLLKREATLEEIFPDYRYTRTDWEREGWHNAETNLHAHRISL